MIDLESPLLNGGFLGFVLGRFTFERCANHLREHLWEICGGPNRLVTWHRQHAVKASGPGALLD
jgi:hypothetical protein